MPTPMAPKPKPSFKWDNAAAKLEPLDAGGTAAGTAAGFGGGTAAILAFALVVRLVGLITINGSGSTMAISSSVNMNCLICWTTEASF